MAVKSGRRIIICDLESEKSLLNIDGQKFWVKESQKEYILNNGIFVQTNGGGGTSTISFTATETINAYAVCVSTGKNADSANVAHKGKIIGINTANVLNGFVGQAVGFGTITNPGWTWTIGDKIYLNGTSLSVTPPTTGFSQFIGNAVSSDTIDVLLGPAILL